LRDTAPAHVRRRGFRLALALQAGDEAVAIIKASDVMVGK
jgi:hypothetical protein